MFSSDKLAARKLRALATDLATQLLGTGWLTEGMAWDDHASTVAPFSAASITAILLWATPGPYPRCEQG